MHKKLMLACMAIVAFAAFSGPVAWASPVLTDEGKIVAVGTTLTAKNTGNVVFTGAVTVTCSTVDLFGEVTENTGSSIKAMIPGGSSSFTGTGTGSDCTSTLFNAPAAVRLESPLCVATVAKTDNIAITGCTGGVEFIVTVTGFEPCTYEAFNITGTFKTSASATFNVAEQSVTLVEGGRFCWTSGKLDMHFDLYTPNGTTQMSIS